jgi:hypothetical protein
LSLTEIRNAGVAPAEHAVSRGRRSSAHLLPAFDEYTVAYKDRASILDPSFTHAPMAALNAVFLINGIVTGSWKRTLRDDAVDIAITSSRPLTATEQRALAREARRYAAFLGSGLAVLRFG